MLVTYGVVTLALMGQWFYHQWVFIIFWSSMLQRKRKKGISFAIIGVIFMVATYWYPTETTVTGTIESISENSYVVRSRTQGYRVMGNYQGTLGDYVSIVGDQTRGQWETERVRSVITQATVTLHNTKPALRGRIWNETREHTLLQDILFSQYREAYPLLTSLSLQLSGFLALVTFLMRPYLGSFRCKIMRCILCIVHVVLFGFSFSALRIALKDVVSQEKQIVILLLLFPGSITKLAFVLSFFRFLYEGLSTRLKYDMSITVFINLRLVYRFNVIEYVLYPLMRIVCGFVYACVLLSFMWLPALEGGMWLLDLYTSFLDSELVQRITIVGKPSILFFLMLIMNAYQLKAYRDTIVAIMCLWVTFYPFSRVTFVDVGQGDAALIQMPFNIDATLLDTGRKQAYSNLKKTLNSQGVKKLDQLIITHDDFDHSENRDALIQDYRPRVITHKQDTIDFFTVFLPDLTYNDANGDSLIVMSWQGILFMADSGIQQERDLIRDHPNLCVQSVKLGHHGSRTSSGREFLQAIQPQYAIVSSKPSTYGHPHDEVMRNLYDQRIIPLQTSQLGNITFVWTPFFDYFVTSNGTFGIINSVIKC